MAAGTLSVGDLLANQQTIADIGEDRVWDSINRNLVVHNDRFMEMVDVLAEPTTDQLKRYGGVDSMVMDEVDEFGRADAQKVTAGVNIGFPLRLFQVTVQWTRKFFQNATGRELAQQFIAAQDADLARAIYEIKRAFFNPTNYTTVDKLVNNAISLDVKRLVNADSAAIPVGPDGTTFVASSHTHYLYTVGTVFAAADVTGAINTVAEHYSSGRIEVYINAANETEVRALTGFTGITPIQVIPALTAAQARTNDLDTSQFFNRRIGYFGNQAAEVWIKPWIPSGYMLVVHRGEGTDSKVLAIRTRRSDTGGLAIAAEDEAYPLRARTLEREYGIGVWDRTGAAVLFRDAGAAGAYVAPTLAV